MCFHKVPTCTERRSSLAFAFWKERRCNSSCMPCILRDAIPDRAHGLLAFRVRQFGRLAETVRITQPYVGIWNWSVLPPDVVAEARWFVAHTALKKKMPGVWVWKADAALPQSDVALPQILIPQTLRPCRTSCLARYTNYNRLSCRQGSSWFYLGSNSSS